ARGIVVDGDKIAILNKAKKNEFKLPGGGVEEGEDYQVAFEREVMEETGCEVHNTVLLGTIEEIKTGNNFYQKSYVFKADVSNNTGKLHLTEKEIGEGARVVWMTIDEAIEKISSCYKDIKASPCDKDEGVYASKFIIKRDLKILDYYKNTYLKEV
ncbi:MAG: NUDIX domain-containing protein, partial [Clostridia bacterium]|nr:NUDIX domain-containing protein [Clostridia bacterium]